jgi:hypothetical protein
MNPPSTARSRRALITGIAVVALISGSVLAWLNLRMVVPEAEVTAYLDGTLGDGRVRFSDVKVDTLRKEESGLLIAVAATARSLGPLYSKIDAAEYLHRALHFDPESTAYVRHLMADGGTPELRAIAGAGSIPADPYQSTIIQMSSPADSLFKFQGVVGARREGGKWSFTLESGGFEGGGPQGSARSAFTEDSFVAGDAKDDARIRAMAVELQMFAIRVAATQRNPEPAKPTVPGVGQEAFLAAIAPGRVFRGTALEFGEQNGTALYLEITALSQGNEVSARLRNEGSWHVARSFQGTWSADGELGAPTLILTSRPDQAVRNAGPYLENAQSWILALHMDPRGSLSGEDKFFKFQFQPVSSDQASVMKARIEAEFERSMAATEAGLLYVGTAHSQVSGASEPVLVRFTGRSEDGKSVEARIESTSHSWTRPARGLVVANSRRSGGEPIRLRTASSDAVGDAPVESILGVREDMDIRLDAENGMLVGEDGRFTYRLELATKADLQRLDAEGAERARHFLGIVRNGIIFDGTFHEEQGFVAHARLEIVSVDRRTGAMQARLRSLAQLHVYRDFAGTCDPAGDSISLDATSRGAFNTGGGFDIPFFKGPAAATLNLSLTANSMAGGIKGDPSWVLEFPTSAFLSAPVENPGANLSSDGAPVFPPFPKATGAYLLSEGGWLALPPNLGHVVVETISPKSELQVPSNLADALTMGVEHLMKDKDSRKVPFLEFAGKDPRPKSSGQAVTILFVGPQPSSAPPVELAAEETKKDGTRTVEVLDGSPDAIRFGEQRMAAYVRQVAPGYTVLTTTSTLAPGPYAFNADRGYELNQE